MPSLKQIRGTSGERAAKNYLEKKGFLLQERNFRTRFGEIDLIMWDRDELVFIEVKLRSPSEWGFPEDFVDEKKKARLLRTALLYLEKKHFQNSFFRFDLIAIVQQYDKYEIEHFTDTIRRDR